MARTDFVDDPTGENPFSEVSADDMNQIGSEINQNTSDISELKSSVESLELAPPAHTHDVEDVNGLGEALEELAGLGEDVAGLEADVLGLGEDVAGLGEGLDAKLDTADLDAETAALVEDAGSDLRAALDGRYSAGGGGGEGEGVSLDWYNVKDYGASGGGADDTDAIKAAIQACWNAGGGTVYFPEDTYGVTEAIYARPRLEHSDTAQSATNTTITLASGASVTNADYSFAWIKITDGTGSGQVRRITSYNGATKVATISNAWDTNPDSSSTYTVQYFPSAIRAISFKGANAQATRIRALEGFTDDSFDGQSIVVRAEASVNDRYATIEDLRIDANSTADYCLNVAGLVERDFHRLLLQGANVAPLVVDGTQNSSFRSCHFQGGQYSTILLNGAASNLFDRCEFAGASVDTVLLDADPSWRMYGWVPGIISPLANQFTKCLMEAPASGQSHMVPLRILAGLYNVFDHCTFSTWYTTGTPSEGCVVVGDGSGDWGIWNNYFDHCQFNRNGDPNENTPDYVVVKSATANTILESCFWTGGEATNTVVRATGSVIIDKPTFICTGPDIVEEAAGAVQYVADLKISGTTAQRPGHGGDGPRPMRYNTETGRWEAYDGSIWANFVTDADLDGDVATLLQDDGSDVRLALDSLYGSGEGEGEGVAVAWGEITGTLADQTDLKNALDAKQDESSLESDITSLVEDVESDLRAALDSLYAGSGEGEGAEAVWGQITGTLTDQTDLKNALDAKQNISSLDEDITSLVEDAESDLRGALDGIYTGGISDGDKGDITVSSSGTVWTIDNGAVTNDKVGTNISADKLTDGTTNKVFTATEKSKLSGIEDNADVTDATNVAAAGAVMESDTSTAAMQFVVDEDDMSSNSDTKVPTQQSVKAYVDANAGGGTPDNGSVTFAKLHADLVVTESEGIGSNDNDTTIPTSAAVKDYVDDAVSEAGGGDMLAATYDPTGVEDDAFDLANMTGTLSADSITDGTTNKAFTATEKSKLSGIEDNADVTDATNVDAAGAVMNSDTSTAAMQFVVDEDNMASDSATKVPTQQSVKAYVDTGLADKVDAVSDAQRIYATDGSGDPTAIPYTADATAETIAFRNADANIAANNVFVGMATAVANGTHTLTADDPPVTIFTSGSTLSALRLPSTGIPAGARYVLINHASADVIAQSSSGNTIVQVKPGCSATMTALQAAPTIPAHWAADYLGGWVEDKLATVEANTESGTSYTLALTDAGKVVETTNSSAVAITVPTNDAVAFPIGTVIEICAMGTGEVTIAGDTGVTVNSPNGKNKIAAQYGAATLRKRDTDEWVLEGNLTS